MYHGFISTLLLVKLHGNAQNDQGIVVVAGVKLATAHKEIWNALQETYRRVGTGVFCCKLAIQHQPWPAEVTPSAWVVCVYTVFFQPKQSGCSTTDPRAFFCMFGQTTSTWSASTLFIPLPFDELYFLRSVDPMRTNYHNYHTAQSMTGLGFRGLEASA